MDHAFEDRRQRVQVRFGDVSEIDQHRVGAQTGSNTTDPRREARGMGATLSGHPEHLRGRGHALVVAGDAVELQHQSDLLQHVPVVVHARLVDPERHPHAARQQAIHGRDAALQAQIRAGVVTDGGAGLDQPLDVVLGEPDSVPERHLGAEKPEVVQMLHRASAPPALGIQLLVGSLE
jgi:hypothetical protein